MLNKKLHTNRFKAIGYVSEIFDDHFLLRVDEHLIKIEHQPIRLTLEVGCSVLCVGKYSYEKEQPIIRAEQVELSDLTHLSMGYVEGSIIKVDRMGTQENAWATVVIRVTHKEAFDANKTTSSIVKVTLSHASLEHIGFDIGEGDLLELEVVATNNDVALTWKTKNVRNHVPLPVLEFYKQYQKDPLKYR